MIVNRPVKKKKISRYTVLCIIMGIIFAVITLRLLYIQVLNYDEYKEKANTTSTRFVSESAPRGEIYDNNGVTLATNKRTYSLTYTQTDEVNKSFYSTMDELFKILNENGESVQDSMILKIDDNNKIYFQFPSNDKDSQNYTELRFKKDRGFNDDIKKELFPKVEGDLSDAQSAQIDKELLAITPTETFYKLVKNYNLIELIDPDYNSKSKKDAYEKMSGEEVTDELLDAGYTLKQIREYMLVKDTLKIQNMKGNKSVTIASNIDKNTVLVIKQKLNDLPGIDITSVPVRYYPYKDLASTVLGYVSSINSSEEDKYTLRGYDASTDLIGKSGIESAFEEQLKGVKGGKTVKVNSSGRVTENLFQLESYPGNNVHLTINSDIQYAAQESLKDGIQNIQANGSSSGHAYKNATRGALVAVDVKTGKILALASYPDYDPNLFAIQGTLSDEDNKKYFAPDYEEFGQELIKRMNLNKTVNELFPKDSKGNRTDPNDLYPKPFYNYATQSLIPPGSTFKPLTAIAGLESGVITPTDIINDTGVFNIHPDVFGKAFAPECLLYHTNGYGHGPINVAKALEVSCNFYFYETGYRLYEKNGGDINALNSLSKYAWQFGLGVDPNSNASASTGIEIAENFGQTYNFTSWKNLSINYAKYGLVDSLRSGEYNGYNFIPFDIGVSDDDNEDLKNAKQSIKDKMVASLKKVGTDEQDSQSFDDFAKDVKKDVEVIMDKSDKYKENVAEAQAKGKNVDLDSQAKIVSEVIAKFTKNDKPSEITSPAQLVYASIGQGMNNYTPLQLASYVSTIANGGTRYKLHLVDKVTDNDGNVVQEFDPEVLNKVSISPETLAAVKDGMSRVNQDDGGTAKAAFTGFPISTAGKTGTADFAENQYERGRAPYATYVSFAPVDDPQIAVVAVVFDGGHGGSIASACRATFEAYFKDKLLADNPNYAAQSETFKKYVQGNPYLEQEKESIGKNTEDGQQEQSKNDDSSSTDTN